MDPVHPSGWKTYQKQFANWSDSDTETYPHPHTDTDESSDTLSLNSESSDGGDEFVIQVGYHKLLQSKKAYKVILEEEDLIS